MIYNTIKKFSSSFDPDNYECIISETNEEGTDFVVDLIYKLNGVKTNCFVLVF